MKSTIFMIIDNADLAKEKGCHPNESTALKKYLPAFTQVKSQISNIKY